MLIVSKYHDYYDSVAYSKGIDKTIVYDREEKDIFDKRYNVNFPSANIRYSREGEREINTLILGFCGKLYPLAIIRDRSTSKKEYVFGVENIQNIHELKYRSSWSFFKNEFEILTESLNSKKVFDIFHEYKVPIFILGKLNPYNDSYNITLNSELKEFGFYRIIDSYTTFQEIEMFISGVIGVNNKPTIEVSDKDKIVSKGFDYKTSFRKEKKK